MCAGFRVASAHTMEMSGSGRGAPPGDERQHGLGGSFGSVADVYERSRPGYPPEAVRWLLAECTDPDIPIEPRTIVDLAAGTGALTRPLLAERHWVLSIDPSRQMLGKLTRRHRWATAVRGSAEAIPLATSSADAIVVGQAFHWFDTDRALAEAARVLRPGGTMGLIWNRRDESVPWVRHLSALLDSPHEWDERWSADLMETLEFDRRFSSAEHTRYRLWQRLDREGLVQLVSSRSYIASLAADERQALLDRVRTLYDMTANQPEGLTLPYTTLCYRVRRD